MAYPFFLQCLGSGTSTWIKGLGQKPSSLSVNPTQCTDACDLHHHSIRKEKKAAKKEEFSDPAFGENFDSGYLDVTKVY